MNLHVALISILEILYIYKFARDRTPQSTCIISEGYQYRIHNTIGGESHEKIAKISHCERSLHLTSGNSVQIR